jgi:hypothetical protein
MQIGGQMMRVHARRARSRAVTAMNECLWYCDSRVGVRIWLMCTRMIHTKPRCMYIAANVYAKAKDDRANATVADKGLNVDSKAITFGSYGGFGEGSHRQ